MFTILKGCFHDQSILEVLICQKELFIYLFSYVLLVQGWFHQILRNYKTLKSEIQYPFYGKWQNYNVKPKSIDTFVSQTSLLGLYLVNLHVLILYILN